MKNLKSFRLFEMNGNEFQLLSDLIDKVDVEQEREILSKARRDIVDIMSKKTGIDPKEMELLSTSVSDWQFTNDEKIIAKTTVFMPEKDIENFKTIKFEKADKGFKIWSNKLTSMEGFPEFVGEDFDADLNNLKSLAGGPKIVKGNYSVASNPLETLEGAPEEVGGSFRADSLPIIRTGEWDPEGWMKAFLESGEAGKKLLLTLPWFSQKGNAGKMYKEYTSQLAMMWPDLPEELKNRIIQESGEEAEELEKNLEKIAKAKNKFF